MAIDYVFPVLLQVKDAWVIVWSSKRQKIWHLWETICAVAIEQLNQLLLLVLQLKHTNINDAAANAI